MINYSQSALHGIVAHIIGNHNEGEDIKYSPGPLQIEDQELEKFVQLFFSHYKDPEFYRFSFPTGEIELNPVYNFAANIFDDPTCLHEQSVKLPGICMKSQNTQTSNQENCILPIVPISS